MNIQSEQKKLLDEFKSTSESLHSNKRLLVSAFLSQKADLEILDSILKRLTTSLNIVVIPTSEPSCTQTAPGI